MDWTVDWTMDQTSGSATTPYCQVAHAHQLIYEKMETDVCYQLSRCDDVIVLSSDETQDEEEKEKLSKVGSEVRRKVRRRLLRNEGITKTDSLAAGFGDRDGCSSGEDSDNGSLTGDYSDDLTVTQFESPTKKIFTPTKKPRISPPSDCSDDEETEKEGHIRCLLVDCVSLCVT